MTLLAVALAGGVGAAARFLLDALVRAWLPGRFPVGTLLINASGSLLLGVLAGLVLAGSAPPSIATVLGTGFCGGYTTFSTASVETVRQLQEERYAAAVVNIAATLLLTVGGATLGLVLA